MLGLVSVETHCSMGIVTVASAALLLDQTCHVGSSLFGNGTSYDEAVCANLANISNREEERYVQEQAEKITYVSRGIQVTSEEISFHRTQLSVIPISR